MSVPDPERILTRLDWTVIRRLDGLLQGNYRTLFHGFGLELAELREYQLTDDVRYIDWYVTARMQTPYVRQYVEDREITAWFLLDLSPSVDFGAVRIRKRDLLVELVTVLARLITRHGNRVGAVLFTGNVERVLPPRGGRIQVLRLSHELLGHQPGGHVPLTDLTVLLEASLGIVQRRAAVFIVSDFISVPGWEDALGVMTRRHEVVGVRLYDPLEVEMPDLGTVILEDAESGEQLFLDTHDRGFRRRFSEAARRREEELKATLSRCGVDLLTLSTEGDLVRELVRFAMLRKQRRAVPASSGCPRSGQSFTSQSAGAGKTQEVRYVVPMV
ncbi:MAG: DUF58 domain-containing protein [Spirochaetota bacterium]